MVPGRPHLPVAQLRPLLLLRLGNGIQPHPRTLAGAGECSSSPLLPGFQPGHNASPTWGRGVGRGGGHMHYLHHCGLDRKPPVYSVATHHVPQVRSNRAHPAPLPQLERQQANESRNRMKRLSRLSRPLQTGSAETRVLYGYPKASIAVGGHPVHYRCSH